MRQRPRRRGPAGAALRVALLVWLCLAPGGWAAAQDILIFRPGSNLATEFTSPNVVLQVQISAFAPIQSVRVNGRPVPVPKATFVNVSQPLQLAPGENRIVVEATTQFETARQEFVFNLKRIGEELPEASRAKLGFQFIGLLGGQYSSNPVKAPDGTSTISGTRGFLVAIPRYDLSAGSASRVRLQSILSRDRYDVKDLAALEVAFTQVTLSLLLGEKKPSQWTLGLGYNTIDQTYDTLLKGKVHLEDDSFVFGGYERAFGKNDSWSFGLEYKNQNLKQESPDPEREEDARVGTVTGSLLLGLGPLRTKTQFGYTATDAIGKLKDQNTSRLNLELALPIGSFIPSIGVRLKSIAYKESDPLLGDKGDSTLTTGALTLNYQFSGSWMILLEALTDTQSSKVDSLKYKNESLMLALVFVY